MAKTSADAAGGGYLLAEQLIKRRAVCSWCTVAALAQLATLPLAVPQARAAWRARRARR